MSKNYDILDDVAARFRDAFADRNRDEAQVSPRTASGGAALDVLAKILADTRRDWAGERPYIGTKTDDAISKMSRRDAEIRRLRLKLNRPRAVVARQFGISPARVSQICGEAAR